MKTSTLLSIIFLLPVWILGQDPVLFEQTMFPNGAAQLESGDYKIPDDPQFTSISFKIRGGHGGKANGLCEGVEGGGGRGAVLEGMFVLGSGPGEIPHGSIIRVIEGQDGVAGPFLEIPAGDFGPGLEFLDQFGTLVIKAGGGGGASAILYKGPNDADFTKANILMVAGGGGGGTAGASINVIKDNCLGQAKGGDGTTGTTGGNGGASESDFLIDSGANGGKNGRGGLAKGGAGGGGLNSNGAGVFCVNDLAASLGGGRAGFPAGSNSSPGQEGCPLGTGGSGFSSGGSGYIGGGGGGGFSGGGGGAVIGGGGGGSSFLSPKAKSVPSFADPHGRFDVTEHFGVYHLTRNSWPVMRNCFRLFKRSLDASGVVTFDIEDYLAEVEIVDDWREFDFKSEKALIVDPEGGPVTLSLSRTTFDCSDAGNFITIDLIATDDMGLSNKREIQIFIEDNLPPSITCQDDITTTTEHYCGVGIPIKPILKDNCANQDEINLLSSNKLRSFFDGDEKFLIFPVGVTEETLSAIDKSGNESSCSFTVTVKDVTPPFNWITDDKHEVFICPDDITINLDPGECEAKVIYHIIGFRDNCYDFPEELPGFTFLGEFRSRHYFLSNSPGQPLDARNSAMALGGHLAVITSQEENDFLTERTDGTPAYIGFSDREMEGSFIWETGEEPVFTNWNEGEPNNSGNEDFVVINFGPAGGWNDSGGSNEFRWILEFGFNPVLAPNKGLGNGSFFPAGTTTLNYQASDLAGNTSNCSFNINVLDIEAPIINCPDNLVVSTNPGDCEAMITFSEPTATDNCGEVSISQTGGRPVNTAFPAGITLETFEATDPSGNTANCSFTVTVNDAEPPVISCPPNRTTTTDPGTCGAMVSFEHTSSDNCAIAGTTLVAGLSSGTLFPIGNTANTIRVKDPSGNTADCSFTVTVNDAEPPTISCPPSRTTTTNAGLCGAIINFEVISSDNCAVESSIQTEGLSSGTIFPIGTTTNTFTVADAAGNTNACSFQITVEDQEAPLAQCQNLTITLDNAGNGRIDPQQINVGSSDACGIAGLHLDIQDFSCGQIGANTVSLTVSDPSGNENTCTATVLVEDHTPPVISCPTNRIVRTEAGACGARVDFTVTSSDNCAGETIAQTAGLNSGVVFPVGTTTNTLTVTDGVGNTGSCSFQVVVEDREAPQALCQNVTIALDNNGAGSITPQQIDSGSSDACGIANLRLDNQDFNCDHLGANIVSLTVSDPSGNESSCTATILVEDTILPTIACPARTTVTCDTSVTATGLPIIKDNCESSPFLSHSTRVVTGDCDWFCQLERIFIVRDGSNNVSQCVQLIEKNVSPLIRQALTSDGDGSSGSAPLILGVTETTLAIDPGSLACLVEWMPYAGNNPTALVRDNGTVGANCTPGLNPVNGNGKITNPLFGEALKLALVLDLDPGFGTTPLNEINCQIVPIIKQHLSNDPTIKELMDLTNKALGNLVLVGFLDELLAALKCINDPIEVCDFE